MFDNKSDYALNKNDKTAIFYKDANGKIYRISVSDMGGIKEFRKWKNWVKMKNHSEEKKDHVHKNHSVSLNELHECLAVVSAIDTDLEHQEMQDIHTAQTHAMVSSIREVLSATQFRRLWMYYVENMTLDSIAKKEGVSHQAISLSVISAMKKIKKLF